jgi:hypothetical protein
MGRRTLVMFWGAVAATVFFLGSAWSAAGRLESGPHALANAAVFAVAVLGLGAAVLVAGRIAFIVGRAQRRARATRQVEP